MSDLGEASGSVPMPAVRRIGAADVRAAVLAGAEDLRRAPRFGLFFGGLYAAGGIVLLLAVTRLHAPWLAYPLAAGFALLGPFAAVGLYEVSRRLEIGAALDWRGVLGAVRRSSGGQLLPMAFVTLFIFLMWMYQVRLLLALFLAGHSFTTLPGFLAVVFTTVDGLLFLAVGHVVGAALALTVFSLTVVSFPLLLDRDVDVVTAMITSVKAVVVSPRPMLAWGAAVVAVLVLAAVPLFLGLAIALPVLGHASWHLYRRAVVPA